MRDIHVVTGQTASGKTSYALKLAQKNKGDLISADSRQVYQKLNIITGKDIPHGSHFTIVEGNFPLDRNFNQTSVQQLNPQLRVKKKRYAPIGFYELKGIKIWGLDIIDPKQNFSSFDYMLVCNRILEKYIPVKTTPILVGGSYLYIKHLIYGLDVQVHPQWDLREKLSTYSVRQLQDRLRNTSPKLFEDMNHSDRLNPRRLMRKIEIALHQTEHASTGTLENTDEIDDITPTNRADISRSKFNILTFTGLRFVSREKKQEIIAKRVRARLNHGALSEVKNLLRNGYSETDPGLKTLGYQQLISHLQGNMTLDEATALWVTAETQYAKRQYIFMKQDEHINWIEV